MKCLFCKRELSRNKNYCWHDNVKVFMHAYGIEMVIDIINDKFKREKYSFTFKGSQINIFRLLSNGYFQHVLSIDHPIIPPAQLQHYLERVLKLKTFL